MSLLRITIVYIHIYFPPRYFGDAIFKDSNAYLIMYETINNDIIRKLCRRVYNTVFPFMKEAQGIQWNNFRYRYAVFSLCQSWGLRSSLSVCCSFVCVLFIALKRNNACSVIQYCAVSRFHFLPFFFSCYFVYISRVSFNVLLLIFVVLLLIFVIFISYLC